MHNRDRSSVFILLATSLLLQACATPPKAPAAPPQATRPTEGTAKLDPAIAEIAKGYTQVKKKDGALLFCKRERQTGSNMSTMTCLTEAQLRQRAEDAKKFGDDMRQHGRRCSSQGPGCQAGG